MKPIIAVVGRPNVGKSTLFNKIVGKRLAIVDDMPGVTRDRLYSDSEWNGFPFTLIDTGGMDIESRDEMMTHIYAQAQIAIEIAAAIVFVVDGVEGLTSNDQTIAEALAKSGKRVVIAVNKCDNPGNPPLGAYDFYGLSQAAHSDFSIVFVSAIHGIGTGDLLDEIVKDFDKAEPQEETDDIKVAVVGKPNAGKSSLINKLLGEDRVIVSPIAGTTRDAIDTPLTVGEDSYMLIDTAGMRKRGKVDEGVERYSVIRALSAVDRADVALILIDAQYGVTEQDTKIAGYAHDNGKAVLVVVNKWDAIEKDSRTMNNYRLTVQEGLNFMLYAPILFISAKTGAGIHKLFDMIKYVANQNATRISTGMFNDCLNGAMARNQPPSDKGKRLKIYYGTQTGIKPPTFRLFINNKKLAHFSYIRYIENQLRETFGFEGTPIKFTLVEKEK